VAQVTACKSSAAVFRKHLVQQIEVAEPVDLTDAFVDRLEQAREYHREIVKHFDECIERAQERRKLAVRAQED
jgi:RNase H-fold protein (predicted Holliday junction resolvase)